MSDARKGKVPDSTAPNGEITTHPLPRNQYHAVAPLEDSVRASKKNETIKREKPKKPSLDKKFIKKKSGVFIKLLGVTVVYFIYAVIGGVIFSYIETPEEKVYLNHVEKWKNDTAILLATDLRKVNPFEPDWAKTVYRHLDIFESDLIKASWNGYRKWDSDKGAWSFHNAFYLSLSLLTTTGYEDAIVRTIWGKVFLLLYLVVGIPLNMYWLFHVGSCFADVWVWLLSGRCFARNRKVQPVTNGNGKHYVLDQALTRPSSSAILTSPANVEKHFDRGILSNQTNVRRVANITPHILVALLFLALYYVFGCVGLFFLHTNWSYIDCLLFNFLTITTTSTSSIGKMHKVNYVYLFYVIGGYWLISMLAHLFYRRVKQNKQNNLTKRRFRRAKRTVPPRQERDN